MNTKEHPLNQLHATLLPFTFQKENVSKLFIISLLIKGHVLIEDLPGVGKTTLAKAFAKSLGMDFSRIQGTSDTLPQDIIGGEIIDLKTKEFTIKQGPIFSDMLLIDEINRMHPKTQSALLEAMEEKQVSINGQRYKLPDIHMIIATQNPIEHSGTYPLPEAQRDRFVCTITIGFPSREIQKDILSNNTYLELDEKIESIQTVLTPKTITEIQKKIPHITISDEILERLINFVDWTRDTNFFRYGMSPRGIGLFCSGLRAHAYLAGRDFVIPEDGLDILIPFLLHRIEFSDESITKKYKEEKLLEKYKEVFKGF